MNKIKFVESKKVYLIGIGMGNPNNLTVEAKNIIESSKIVIGAKRILEAVKDFIHCDTFDCYDSKMIAKRLEEAYSKTGVFPCHFCVVFSGDTGFYSGAKKLSEELCKTGWAIECIAGITSAQYLASKLCEDWQSWNLVSAHGIDCDIGIALAFNQKSFFLTGGKITSNTIFDFIIQNKINSKIVVADKLSYDDEIILIEKFNFDEENDELKTKISSFKLKIENLKLAVVFVSTDEDSYSYKNLGSGAIKDEFFIRNIEIDNQKLVPMTKQNIRSSIISILNIKENEIVWDIGAGTGAVSIDLAHSCKCHVYAVEEKKQAFDLELLNKRKFHAWNLDFINGKAPLILENLPTPDSVFIGGSEGKLLQIIDLIFSKNDKAKILVSAVTMETLSLCNEIHKKFDVKIAYTQLSISNSAKLGSYNLMKAENPIYLVSIIKNEK